MDDETRFKFDGSGYLVKSSEEMRKIFPENIYPKPKHLSFEEAASMPLVFMTSYQMLIERAQIKKNDLILIYGGTSGIGMAAIQIAKDVGATVITTVGNNEKKDFVKKLNPDYILNHQEDNLYKIFHIIKNVFLFRI